VTLDWLPLAMGSRGYRSACGKYAVCSIGPEGGETWETWKLAPVGPWFSQLALGLPDEATARTRAEADAQKVAA
jgi:hypothetical protein